MDVTLYQNGFQPPVKPKSLGCGCGCSKCGGNGLSGTIDWFSDGVSLGKKVFVIVGIGALAYLTYKIFTYEGMGEKQSGTTN